MQAKAEIPGYIQIVSGGNQTVFSFWLLLWDSHSIISIACPTGSTLAGWPKTLIVSRKVTEVHIQGNSIPNSSERTCDEQPGPESAAGTAAAKPTLAATRAAHLRLDHMHGIPGRHPLENMFPPAINHHSRLGI